GRKLKPETGDGRAINIFGTSQMSSFHMRLLFELGSSMDFRLYQLNVCREFWEDVETPQEERWKRIRRTKIGSDETGEFLDIGGSDNKLLSRWGKPGRENIRLLGNLEEASQRKVRFVSDWKSAPEEAPGKKSVLKTVQGHILNRTTPENAGKKMEQDRSIQIAGCPGAYREIEAVHNSIIDNMLEDPSIKLTDIAILVPDMAAYKSVLESVFSRQPRHVPYNLTDSAATNDSVIAQALTAMLELAAGSFTRRDVFDLIFNAAFLAGIGRTREEALVWARWADELSIFHSFDKKDKARSGYADNDLYTWQQGLRRLRLGRIMETPEEGVDDDKAFAAWRDIAPFSDIDSRDTASVSVFCLVVETLLRRLSDIFKKRYSCAGWSGILGSLIDDYLAVPEDRPDEERVVKKIRDYLMELADNDILLGGISGVNAVDLQFIREYIEERLGKIKTGRGKYLAGGVTISTLLPMRPIPFKIVYVVGLTEGEFPGYPERSMLDLRHHQRKIGDVSKPEANRYLFLETLVSTRSKLYLTYVSRDLEKDKELNPCSLVNELKDYLDENILKEGFKTLKDAFPEWPDDIPLKGSSDKYLAATGKAKAWSDILVNFSVPDRLACLLDVKGRIAGAKKIDGALAKKIKELVPDQRAEPKEAALPEEERVTIRELRRFLENPVEAAIRRHLELYDERGQLPAAAEDEPFYSVWPMDREFGSGILSRFIANWKAGKAEVEYDRVVEEHFDRYYRYCRLRGKVPDEAFGDLDKKRFEALLKLRLEGEDGIISFLQQRSGNEFHANLILGEAYRAAGGGLTFPPLELNVKGMKAKLHGEIPFVWKDKKGKAYETLVIADRNKPLARSPQKELIIPFLFYASLMALKGQGKRPDPQLGWIEDMPIRIHVAFKDGVDDPWTYRISPKDAAAYLASLAGGLLAPETFEIIPFALITKKDHLKRPDEMKKDAPKAEKELYKQMLEEAIDREGEKRYFSEYAPSDVARLCGGEVPEDVYDKVLERLGPLYSNITNAPK
ncbi:MAG: exodeoxyribonuclease V subunit gamma, partial [Candidatus Omnitrophica bacterium]|nr:exodeoxyribonuclease V subunit gamma [Candidatus Omnitrophota bacterium]